MLQIFRHLCVRCNSVQWQGIGSICAAIPEEGLPKAAGWTLKQHLCISAFFSIFFFNDMLSIGMCRLKNGISIFSCLCVCL